MAYLLVLILDDVSKMRDVLSAWEEAGVPGITILHSVGFQRAKGILGRTDIPFAATLRDLLHAEEIHNRTLLSVIEDEQVLERAIQAASQVVGDFTAPHSGILFTIPIAKTIGLKKRRPAEGPSAPEHPPMHIHKEKYAELKVSEALNWLRLEPTIVREDASLEGVIREVVKEPSLRTLCVVNEDGVLVGVIPFRLLFEEVFFYVLPELFISEAVELKDATALAGRISARKARDYMAPPVWVKPHETMLEAFRRMYKAKVDGLPVVDDDLRIIGYLSLMGLLQIWVKEER